MHSNFCTILLSTTPTTTRSFTYKNINSLIKNISYYRNHYSHNQTSTSTSTTTTTKRLLYSSNSLGSLNKWYTTYIDKHGTLTDKDAYTMICDMSNDERTALTRALTLWESQKVKGEFEGGE